jgi:hypothetical protein
MGIPVDVPSMIIGAVVGAVVYWLATHTSEWFEA